MSDHGGVRVYYGTTSGSGRKALEAMEEPHLMVSYATDRNTPWSEHRESLFVDSGGYSLMVASETGTYDDSDDDYLSYIERYAPERWALRDYPCEPDVLERHGRTVAEQQERTTAHHVAMLDAVDARGTPGEPVACVQGWDEREYVHHIDALRAAGVFDRVDHVAVGSVCRRGSTGEIRRIIQRVRAELDSDLSLHAFGVKKSILGCPDTRDALDSVDTTAWYYNEYQHEQHGEPAWQRFVLLYLQYQRGLRKLTGTRHWHPDQSKLATFDVEGQT